jgi:transposase
MNWSARPRCRIRRSERHPGFCADLDPWLAEAGRCGVPTIETFAAGPEQDAVAVRAALTTRWSKGRAEGQITHLNLITRTVSGRASFDFLRHRILRAA